MSKARLYLCTCIAVIGLFHTVFAPSPTFGKIELLIPERIEQCERQNNYISDLDNCCGYVRCVSGYLGSPYFYNGVYGIKMDCPASSIWHPVLCLCVSRDEYNFACPIDTCAFRDTDGTCGEFLDEDECCLEQLDIHQVLSFENSQIYKRINDTHYEFRGDIQGCPEGQIFYLDACCCEGIPTVTEQECLYYSFDDRKIINNRGLISKGVRTTPNQEDLGDWLIVGGVSACDRVEDIVLLVNPDDLAGSWRHFCLSLNRTGFVNVVLNGRPFSILERERLAEIDFEEIMRAVMNDIELLASADYGDSDLNDIMNNVVVEDMNIFKNLAGGVFLDWIFFYDETVRKIVKWITNLHSKDRTIEELAQVFGPFSELRQETQFVIQDLTDRRQLVIEIAKAVDISPEAQLMADLVAKKLDRLRYMVQLMDPILIDEDDGTEYSPVDSAVSIGSYLTGISFRKKRDTAKSIDVDLIDPDYLRVLVTTRPLREWLKYVIPEDEVSHTNEHYLNESRKDERAKNVDTPSRAKRNNVPIPGDPLVLRIISSKQPLRLGDGFIGELDEFVLCDFVPDMDAILALYESNVIPTQPLGEWHV
ncbi:unnamed protein product [Owenia fusiformis]|uniref:Uncharacterized protein n=1 Tax=Owenia fusiformis TaxID=6347 RepID=A0A8S4PMY3_OWEFU|nr:unnamed protein product [Owenia fusiformis]